MRYKAPWSMTSPVSILGQSFELDRNNEFEAPDHFADAARQADIVPLGLPPVQLNQNINRTMVSDPMSSMKPDPALARRLEQERQAKAEEQERLEAERKAEFDAKGDDTLEGAGLSKGPGPAVGEDSDVKFPPVGDPPPFIADKIVPPAGEDTANASG